MEIIWFLLLSLIGAAAGLMVYIYNLKKGQFEDPEEPKYQLFREEVCRLPEKENKKNAKVSK